MFGILLIIQGVLHFFKGNFIGGMWWFFIGMFLRNAAKMSYQQLLVRKTLEGETVGHFMRGEPVTVPPSTTVAELVEDFIYRHHFKMFPVVEGLDRLLGCVTMKQVKEIPREDWHQQTVGKIAVGCSSEYTVDSRSDAMEALARRNRTGASRLMVTEGNRLVGIISLKDLLKFLELKIELEP